MSRERRERRGERSVIMSCVQEEEFPTFSTRSLSLSWIMTAARICSTHQVTRRRSESRSCVPATRRVRRILAR